MTSQAPLTFKDQKARPRGAITMARHGEPALSRRVSLSAQGYGDWWARYEEGGLLSGQIPPQCLLIYAKKAQFIFSSTKLRAIETAEAVCGGREFTAMELFVEAPLPPPPLPEFIRMSPKSSSWGAISRFWWYWLDYHKDCESRAEATLRAKAAAQFLSEKALEGDVLLLAHGFFNYMISRELKKMGYVKSVEQGFRYWACRRYEYR
jgi:broad specificity phosphatase PhoE